MPNEPIKAIPGLRQLRHFLVVAEEKSISRAALRLCIKPSPLSHSIKKLEEQLGMPLFHRNGALRLTRVGESFALEVGRMLHAFEGAKTQALAIAKGYGDVLRIGLADGVARSPLCTPSLEASSCWTLPGKPGITAVLSADFASSRVVS